jgi:cystathionine beta-lyase family protein involved in aluminum resistance
VIELLCDTFAIDERIRVAGTRAYERTRTLNYPAQGRVKARVLRAFLDEGVDESDLAGTSGYGYDDAARERYESLLARVLGAERALARLSIVSGTHAIVTALAACVPPGRRLIAVAGRPYDTLRNAICDADYSLVSQGILYEEIALRGDGTPDLDAIAVAAAKDDAAVVFVQRSRGYAPRPSLDVGACAQVTARVKRVAPQVAVLVDNCYGELVEEREPTHDGADLVIGIADQELRRFARARRGLRSRPRRSRGACERPLIRPGASQRPWADTWFWARIRARALYCADDR